MTTKGILPITELLEENLNLSMKQLHDGGFKDTIAYVTIMAWRNFLPQIRTLELSLIEKAKEEEKNRIVDKLNRRLEEIEREDGYHIENLRQISGLKGAIDLITNQ